MRTETTFARSLHRFILSSLSVTVLLTTLVVAVCSFTVNRENLTELGQKQLELLSKNLSNTVDKVESTSLGLMFNSTIQSVLINPALLEDYEGHNLISYVFSDYRNFTDPGNVILFDAEGHLLTSSEGYSPYANLHSLEFFPMIERSQGAPVWIGPHVDRHDLRSSTSPVVSLTQKIRRLDLSTPSNSGKVIGYILINLETETFRIQLEEGNWFDKGRLSLEMTDGTAIASWGEESRTSSLKTTSRLSSSWMLRGEIPLSEVFNIPLWIIAALIVELILIYIFSRIANSLARDITVPLEQLEASMKEETLDSLPASFPETGLSEIDSIRQSYSQMLLRLSELSGELAEKKVREKELEVASIKAELSALQHQINPHFLYNTLDSISWMADAEGNEEVVAMVSHLGDFLRFHTKASGLVSLEEELRNAEDYVYIQKIRYGERFRYRATADPSLLSLPVISLIIQPLVENAIIHGAEGSTENGVEVVTEVKKADGIVTITVTDNGCGMSLERLDKIRQGIAEGESIGLSNVAKRLKLTYGEEASLTVQSTEGEGTSVQLTFPEQPRNN